MYGLKKLIRNFLARYIKSYLYKTYLFDEVSVALPLK